MRLVQLVVQNIICTIVTVIVCMVIAYIVSKPLNAALHPEATAFKAAVGSGRTVGIENDKLRSYEATVKLAIAGGVLIGLIVSQVAFVIAHGRQFTVKDAA